MRALDFFALLALLYVFVGVQVLYRVVKEWRALWDDKLTLEEARLAARAAFFVLLPPVVALHEIGHAVAIELLGLDVVGWTFWGYMGAVAASGSAGPLGDFAIALAGNAVSFAIGVAALAFGYFRPGHPVRNILAIELGRQLMILQLVFYPALCIAFPGDYDIIYDFTKTPLPSAVIGAVHGAILIAGYGMFWRRTGRKRAALLCSSLASETVEMERRLRADPNDLEARRRLGTVMLAADDVRAAAEHLAPVIASGAADAKTRLAYASALADLGRAEEAIPEAAAAREGLLDPEARRAADLVLLRAKIIARKTEEALFDAERLRSERPDDDAVLVLWARAMAAVGRKEEARKLVTPMLEHASDERLPVLRRLYDELR